MTLQHPQPVTKPHDIKESEKFYKDVFCILNENKLSFLIGGTYAWRKYTTIRRETKDMDLFVKTGDYPKILNTLSGHGYKTEVTDARWLAKAFQNKFFIDFIFGSVNGTNPVTDSWFENAPIVEMFGEKVKLIPPEELIGSKALRQDRYNFDGADVDHLILKVGTKINWKSLLSIMEQNWEVLLGHLIRFRYVYPSEREIIPRWLMEELIARLHEQFKAPTPKDKVCRGSFLSWNQYEIDVKEWGFKDYSY